MITTPMELGMTLQQTDKSIKKSNSFVSTYSSVIGKFGVRYGFTGLTCLALRDTLVTASLLTFPGMLKVNLRSYLDQNDVNISDKLLHTFSGGVVGALYAILTHPLDTIKTVQQVTLRSAVTKEECSILSVVKSIYNSKGMSGYYHGLAWRTARVTPHVAIISSITENLTSMLNKKWY